ncbi:glycosyltransferase family protein [Gluconobacter morbifer]|uniref:Glycosyltransferase 2-like domain-containing protein n=1 Tax=Gluconobacter morbifer G707 TaxID=1088869 RepID=G6XIQ3_9PROT|nr:glycosyltransferase family 2 protein [Gluconobacter morbifer]EHH68693.1 hypothetical protein GMO_14630 [Gluconobacter morbifer G707]
MPIIRCVMMQRNEGDKFARWLSHYAGLFGFENLTILDNGSTDPFTLALLAQAERQGSTIRREFSSNGDFANRGHHVANIIREWDANSEYDFALPVTCHELLAVCTDRGLSLATSDIHAEFESLLNEQSALRLEFSLFNVPGKPGWYAPARHYTKDFLPAGSIQSCDNDNHTLLSALAPGHRSTRFTYFHDYHTTYEAWQLKLRTLAGGHTETGSLDALRPYLSTTNPDQALTVGNFLLTEKEYTGLYDNEIQIFAPTGSSSVITMRHGSAEPVIWNGEDYLRLNPDIASSTLGPLGHYLMSGYQENRQISD